MSNPIDTSFTACQQRFREHLAATQPCTQLADAFAAVLVQFFAYLPSLGVYHQVDGITAQHVTHVQEAFQATLRHPLSQPRRGSLEPALLLSPAQWLFAARLFCHYLWQSGVLPADPADGVLRLPVLPRFRRALGELEAESMLLAEDLAVDRRQRPLRTALALRDRALLHLLYRDAVNPLDLRGAKVSPFRLDCGTLYTRPRGTEGRSIPLSPSTLAHVQDYFDRGRPQLPHSEPQSALFLTVDGKPLDDATLRAVVREAAAEAGLSLAVTPTAFYTAGRTHRTPL